MTEPLIQSMAFHLVVVPFAIMAGGMSLVLLIMLIGAGFTK